MRLSYEDVMRLSLERGFFMPSCEVYADAPAGFWEYGPLGVSLRNRFIELWRKEIVRRDGMLEIDGSQIMSRTVFVASGHLESFADPGVQCTKCGTILRADHLIQEKTGGTIAERLPTKDYDRLIRDNQLRCPNCGGTFGEVRLFSTMFKVGIGPTGEEAYLRPETAQSIFVDFPRLFKVMRLKLPCGISQFGKSFRNEVSPRRSLIRLREFYQAETEIFFNPKNAATHSKFQEVSQQVLRLAQSANEGSIRSMTASEAVKQGLLPNELIAYYLALLAQFYEKTGLQMERTRFRELGGQEKAFYAASAYDFEVETSLGWIELVACNYRTDYDLGGHARVSKTDMQVQDGDSKVLPHVFELSLGVDRSLYCILEHSYRKEPNRAVLSLRPHLAPVSLGVLPLVDKNGLPQHAQDIADTFKQRIAVFFDESGSIGRRYRRLDEIGTPFCITVDYDTLKDGTVTVRDRDTMQQQRVPKSELLNYVLLRLEQP